MLQEMRNLHSFLVFKVSLIVFWFLALLSTLNEKHVQNLNWGGAGFRM